MCLGGGNHHVGEYFNDVKHGAGKYSFTKTGKTLHGIWHNDIPIFGEIVQMSVYQPTFPHLYPMPELGLKDSDMVLKNCLKSQQHAVDDNATKYDSEEEQMVDQVDTALHDIGEGTRYESMDMRKVLTEIESDIAQVTDPVLAAQTADYLLAMEYFWRSNADSWGPRPKRVQILSAKNSVELSKIKREFETA